MRQPCTVAKVPVRVALLLLWLIFEQALQEVRAPVCLEFYPIQLDTEHVKPATAHTGFPVVPRNHVQAMWLERAARFMTQVTSKFTADNKQNVIICQIRCQKSMRLV